MIANFLGVGIDACTYEEMFHRIDDWLNNKQSRSHHIACVNAYNVTLSLNNDRLRKIYNGADIVGADGMPFVYWIRSVLKAKRDRLAAPEIGSSLKGVGKSDFGGGSAIARGDRV